MYTIIITQTDIVEVEHGHDWELGAGKSPKDYGYTPLIKTSKEVEREVLKQSLPELDLITVVKALNGIK